METRVSKGKNGVFEAEKSILQRQLLTGADSGEAHLPSDAMVPPQYGHGSRFSKDYSISSIMGNF